MIGPEKLLVVILGTLLAISLGLLLFVDIDPDATRSIAIGVCMALVLLLGVGVIFPVRRYLKRQREAGDEQSAGDR